MRYFIIILSAALILGGISSTIATAQTWKLVSPGGGGSGGGVSCPPPWGADTPSSFIRHGEYVEAYRNISGFNCQKSWRACNNGTLMGDSAYRYESCEQYEAPSYQATRTGYAKIALVPVTVSMTINGVTSYTNACRSYGLDRPGTSSTSSACALFFGAPATGDNCNQGNHWQNYTLSQNFPGGKVLYMDLPTASDPGGHTYAGLYWYTMPARNAGQTLANDYNSCCSGPGNVASRTLQPGDYLVCAIPD